MTSKLIAKQEKANKANLLSSKLAIKELFKKRQAELDKIKLNSKQVV
jgi:hypothetical protein